MSEREFNPEMNKFKKPRNITSKEDLVKFWTAWREVYGLTMRNSEYEKRFLEQKADESLQDIEGEGTPKFFYVIEDEKGDIVVTGELTIQEKTPGEKNGYLSLLTVREQDRKKGLAKQMTDVRIEKAREMNCTHVTTEVLLDNEQALRSKERDGFTIQETQKHKVILRKDIT